MMRYYTEKPDWPRTVFGEIYSCNHPVYSKCTLFLIQTRGLAVIQQRYDPLSKHTWWGEIDPWLTAELYLHKDFHNYFEAMSTEKTGDLYFTVTIRQIMWALRMKPLKREKWETVFDRKGV